MHLRLRIVAFFCLGLTVQSAGAQTPGQNGKPVIASVDTNNQPTLTPATDLTLVNTNLGIGTATPAHKLDVVGQVNASGGLCIGGDCRSTWPAAGGSGSSPWTVSGTSVLYNAGNVGVGTSTPAFKLDVTGQVNAASGVCIAGDCRTSWATSTNPWTVSGTNVSYTAGSVEVLNTVKSSAGNDLYLNAGSANRDVFFQVNGTTLMTARGRTGSVGIGTMTPATKLHVIGDIRADETVTVGSSTAPGWFGGSAGNARYYGYSPLGIMMMNGVMNIHGGFISHFSDGATTGRSFIIGRTYDAVSYTPELVVDFKGNVGIGTVAPIQKLHVEGNVHVSGNISAKFQDVAEWVDASEELSAGTVVAIDEDAINEVRQSIRGYESSVAGVVSPQPGIVLGEAGAGRLLIAHTGRVRVKVDASYGAIRAGDLLVTSETAGHAMRSTPVQIGGISIHRPGTVIGKALESLAAGRGEILVLIALQ